MELRVFLSHSNHDKPMVLRLAEDLRAAGVGVWLDEWEILVGDRIVQKIQQGIAESDYLAIWLTKEAVRSGWVEREWQTKYGQEVNSETTAILPLLAEDCELPLLLQDRAWADFRYDYESGLRKLLKVFQRRPNAPQPTDTDSSVTSRPMRNLIHEVLPFHNILLPQEGIHEGFEDQHVKEIRPSGALLPFLVSELVSRGVVDVNVLDGHRYDSTLPLLPATFRKRVKRLSDWPKLTSTAFGCFQPLFDELDVESEGFDGPFRSRRLNENKQKALGAGLFVMSELPSFLCALKHRLLCHFDLDSVLGALKVLNNDGVRSPEMRARVAVLLGVLRSYRKVSHNCILIASKAPLELVGRFTELTEDIRYQNLSRRLHRFGFLAEPLASVVRGVNDAAARFLQVREFRNAMQGKRLLAVAREPPPARSAFASALFGDEYLPPIVNLRPAIDEAWEGLVRHYPNKTFYQYTGGDREVPWKIRTLDLREEESGTNGVIAG